MVRAAQAVYGGRAAEDRAAMEQLWGAPVPDHLRSWIDEEADDDDVIQEVLASIVGHVNSPEKRCMAVDVLTALKSAGSTATRRQCIDVPSLVRLARMFLRPKQATSPVALEGRGDAAAFVLVDEGAATAAAGGAGGADDKHAGTGTSAVAGTAPAPVPAGHASPYEPMLMDETPAAAGAGSSPSPSAAAHAPAPASVAPASAPPTADVPLPETATEADNQVKRLVEHMLEAAQSCAAKSEDHLFNPQEWEQEYENMFGSRPLDELSSDKHESFRTICKSPTPFNIPKLCLSLCKQDWFPVKKVLPSGPVFEAEGWPEDDKGKRPGNKFLLNMLKAASACVDKISGGWFTCADWERQYHEMFGRNPMDDMRACEDQVRAHLFLNKGPPRSFKSLCYRLGKQIWLPIETGDEGKLTYSPGAFDLVEATSGGSKGGPVSLDHYLDQLTAAAERAARESGQFSPDDWEVEFHRTTGRDPMDVAGTLSDDLRRSVNLRTIPTTFASLCNQLVTRGKLRVNRVPAPSITFELRRIDGGGQATGGGAATVATGSDSGPGEEAGSGRGSRTGSVGSAPGTAADVRAASAPGHGARGGFMSPERSAPALGAGAAKPDVMAYPGQGLPQGGPGLPLLPHGLGGLGAGGVGALDAASVATDPRSIWQGGAGHT